MKRRYDIDWIRDITVLSIIFFIVLLYFLLGKVQLCLCDRE